MQADNTESEAQWPLIPVGLPSTEKRQRIEPPPSRAKPILVDEDDEEWNEVHATDEDVDGDDEDYVEELKLVPALKKSAAKSKPSGKGTPRAAAPKREGRPVGKVPEADSSNYIDDVVSHGAAQAKPAPARKKAAAKAVRKEIIIVDKKTKSSSAVKTSTLAAPIDLTGAPDASKAKHKKAQPKSTPIRRPAEAKKAIAAAAKAAKSTKKAPVSRDAADAKADGRRKLSKGKLQELEVECIDSTEGEEGPDSDEKNEESESLATPLCHIWTSPSIALGQHQDTTSGVTSTAFKQDFLWDENLFTDSDSSKLQADKNEDEAAAETTAVTTQDRPLGKRQMRSVQQSQIRQNLMMGNLDPHTMVQCESYRLKESCVDLTSRSSRGSGTLEPPFQVRVHPDATFICDLHSHLATCEIIGFLGGRWNEATKTLDIQAAFPCRSLMIDGDDGSTDVEMDPGSEIELREIIQNAQLEVVGWYHSHPAFAPDPSVRDIENQGNYQNLFARRTRVANSNVKPGFIEVVSEPFVGLIVGTYDTRRDTPVSLFRYFHVRKEKVSSSDQRDIKMPYELVPSSRHYRSVLQSEKRAKMEKKAMYSSVFNAMIGKETPFKKPVLPPLGDDEIYRGPALAGRPSKLSNPSSSTKKRKPSFEVVATSLKAVKRVRPRGRAPRKLPVNGQEIGNAIVDVSDEDLRLEENKQSDAKETPVIEAPVDVVEDADTTSVKPLKVDDGRAPEKLDQTQVEAVDDETTMIVDESTEKMDVTPSSNDVVIAELVAVTATSNDTENTSGPNASELVKEPSEIPHVEWFTENPEEENDVICVLPEIESDPEDKMDILMKPQAPTLVSEIGSLDEDSKCSPQALGKQVSSCVEIVMENVLTNVVAVVNDVTSVSKVTQSRHEEMQLMAETIDSKRLNSPLDTSTRRKAASNTVPCLDIQKPVELLSLKRAPPPVITDSTYDVPSTESTPAMAQSHSNPGSANGRRRNRKPAQTVKKQGFPVHAPSQDNTRSSPLSGHSAGNLQDRSAYAAAFQVNGPIIDRGGTISVYSDRENTRAFHDTKSIGTDVGAPQVKPEEYIYDVEFSQHVNDAILEKHLAMKNEPVVQPAESKVALLVESMASRENNSSQVAAGMMEIEADGANVSEVLPRAHSDGVITDLDDVNMEPAKSKETPDTMTPVLHTVDSLDGSSSVLAQTDIQSSQDDAETSEMSEPTSAPILKTKSDESIPSILSSTEADQGQDGAIDNGFKSLVVAQAVSSVMEDCLSQLIENEICANELHVRKLDVVEEVVDLCHDKLEQKTIEHETTSISDGELAEQKVVKQGITPGTEDVVSPDKTEETTPGDNQPNVIEPEVYIEPEVISVGDIKVGLSSELSQQRSSVSEINPLIASPQEMPSITDIATCADAEAVADVVDQSGKHLVSCVESTVVVKSEADIPDTPLYLRCGAGQKVQDIQTSLASVMPTLMLMKEQARWLHGTNQVETTSNSVKPESQQATKSNDAVETREEKEQKLLHSLRTKYGTGSAACAEQAITLIDYYRKFARRTELKEMWKGKTSKLAKIEASLMEYVQRINVPVALRQDFVKVSVLKRRVV